MTVIDVTRLLQEGVSAGDRLVAVIDPLNLIACEEVSRVLGGEAIVYENELSFRLAYEPLRICQDKGEQLRVFIVVKSEENLPKDIQAKARPVLLKPSSILKGLHATVDKLISTKEDLRRVSAEIGGAQLPLVRYTYQETVNLILRVLLNMPPRPTPEDAVASLWKLHFQRKEPISATLTEEVGKRIRIISGLEEEPGPLVSNKQTYLQWLQELFSHSLRYALGLTTVAQRAVSFDTESLRPLVDRIEQHLDLSELVKEAAQLDEERLVDALARCPFPNLKKNLSTLTAQKVLKKGEVSERIREKKAAYSATPLDKAVTYLDLVTPRRTPKDASGWLRLGVELSQAEILLDELEDTGTPFREQHNEWIYKINKKFAEFIKVNYTKWLQKPRPPLTIDILSEQVLPRAKAGEKVCFIVYDGMSYDHWLAIKPLVRDLLSEEPTDEPCFAVLPTTTTYGRNAIFASKFPRDIVSAHGIDWLKTNIHEEELLKEQLRAFGVRGHYIKAYKWEKTDLNAVLEELAKGTPFIAAVSNFVDSLIAAAPTGRINNVELRQFVRSRFRESYEFQLLKKAREKGYLIIITSDHGNTLVSKTASVLGVAPEDKKTSRYMHLKSLVRQLPEDVFLVRQPAAWGLPSDDEIKFYLFAYGFLKFQAGVERDIEFVVHGGISLQEMVVPLVRIGDGK